MLRRATSIAVWYGVLPFCISPCTETGACCVIAWICAWLNCGPCACAAIAGAAAGFPCAVTGARAWPPGFWSTKLPASGWTFGSIGKPPPGSGVGFAGSPPKSPICWFW